jgi:mono/diheme cytochrome c family protein
MTRLIVLLALSCALGLSKTETQADDGSFFRERVAPVLEKRCVSCHGEVAPKGGLTLSTASSLLKGGKSGPSVVPGMPEESLLVENITGEPAAMPKKGPPLSARQSADIRQWISDGAHWPDGLVLHDRRFEGESWWAFASLERPKVPAVKSSEHTHAGRWVHPECPGRALIITQPRGRSPDLDSPGHL